MVRMTNKYGSEVKQDEYELWMEYSFIGQTTARKLHKIWPTYTRMLGRWTIKGQPILYIKGQPNIETV
jgi:hypothetical protein